METPHDLTPVVTIDGPGGSGKGTASFLLAQSLGWRLLDSGALYRVLGLAAQRHGVKLSDEPALTVLAAHLDVQFIPDENTGLCHVILEGEQVDDVVRSEEAGANASRVAAFAAVRTALLDRQRAFREAPGLVADGRDMGTVVFNDAQLKIFLIASAEERAKRRYNQLKGKGFDGTLRDLFQDIQSRDERDANRAVSPLKPSDDAVILDSTALSIEEVLDKILLEVRARGLM